MTDQATPTGDVSERVVRVFVSSTFRDMQAEREELVKRVFPELRKLCEQRGVTWGEVDLRWGVTEEQKAEGKVLPICLAEIQGCRPYFIGLLGERYGWIPDEIPQELVEREPWLSEHRERSVTELEILHGVLNNPEMAGHTLFYFRNPSYIDSLPESERADHRELPTAEEVAQHGQDEADRRAQERAEKLQRLKQEIRQSALPLREDYPDPRTLGELVLADLGAIIDRVYPEGTEPDALEREGADHEAFARSRARVYIGGEANFERLDAHASGDGPPLILLGDSGVGKSALLANWALRHRAVNPDELVLVHFIGASPYSAEWAAMLRRIMGELARRFEIDGEIPDDPSELRAAFANWLHMAAQRGRVVLVLDALNQLEDREGAPELVWLPPVIPPDVRLVCSTLQGRALDEVRRRGWPTLEVEPLEQVERERLIVDYLAQYRKALAHSQVKRLAAAPQGANPLFLRVLLEELRLWGEHETLDEAIDRYLGAEAIDDLYDQILARYEADYERERPGLVDDAMSLIWAARRGLSEADLLELLGTAGEPLPGAHWSPLYLATEQSLVNRAGLLGFSHDYLREAVSTRYLPTDTERQAAHLRLADYFEGQSPGWRRVDELPWQLAEASCWERLGALLGDPAFFESAWQHDQLEVKTYWARLEANSRVRLVETYRPIFDAPDRHGDHLWGLASLLFHTGHPEEALRVRGDHIEHYRESGDRAFLQALLGNQAGTLAARGELDEAMTIYQEQERICRELGHRAGLGRSLGGQALIRKARGELDEAMALHKEEERICRELGDRAGLSRSLGNQAGIPQARGELEEAMALHKEQERICRELGDRARLHISLGNQALILRDRGALEDAMALQREKERICRELGDLAGLQRSLGEQGVILHDRGEHEEAMALHKEAERICRELGDPAGLEASLGRQALILWTRGELDEAMALNKEAERICRELGDLAELQISLGNQALILQDRGELDEAMALHKEQERICRELGYRVGLQMSLGNQAAILQERGQLEEAMALNKEQERICRELGHRAGLQMSLGNQALILQVRGELDQAMPLYKEAERICRELGNRAGLQTSLGNQAVILHMRGELDAAMALYKEAELICRELGDRAGLQRSLGNQALILEGRGELEEALSLYDEQERTCSEIGELAGLAKALVNKADVMSRMGRAGEALPLAEEAHRLCDDQGLTSLVDEIRSMLDEIRSRAV